MNARALLAAASLIVLSSPAWAQTMDHSKMPGMQMPASPAPVPVPKPAAKPVAKPADDPACLPEHAAMGHCTPKAAAATPVPVDPHAGHDMPTPAPSQPDPHAGHDMSTMAPAQADLHAGHDMSTMSMGPPDIPTSADNPGRPPEAPVPPAVLSGPVHAADLVFGADAMAASRRTLVHENGDVRTTAVMIDRLQLSPVAVGLNSVPTVV